MQEFTFFNSVAERLTMVGVAALVLLAGLPAKAVAVTVQIDVSTLFNKDAVRKSGTELAPAPSTIDRSNFVFVTQAQGGLTNGLPNNAFFPANADHPVVQLGWRDSETPQTNQNARFVTGSGAGTQFTLSPPAGLYDVLQIYATSTEGDSSLTIILHYATGPDQVLSNFVVDDWFDDPVSNPNGFDLIDGRRRWSLTMDDLEYTSPPAAGNDPAIFGYNLNPDPTRLLQSITIEKTSPGGFFVFFGATGEVSAFDADGDGVTDSEDDCPDSDLSATVIIDGCNSGVPNPVFPSGCTISDLIAACAEGARNHGEFVSCVSHVTNDLKKAGTITDQQKDAIQSCAEQADIP